MSKRFLVVLLSTLICTLAHGADPVGTKPGIKSGIKPGLKKPINKKIVNSRPKDLKVQRFVKLNVNGDKMVKDQINNLIWEVKAPNQALLNYGNPHDNGNKYRWYNSNSATNGGHPGFNGNGTDTQDFIKALNDKRYVGISDWRMPPIDELKTLVDETRKDPAIDTEFFPNTVSAHYWSATTWPYSDQVGRCAWNIHFYHGGANGAVTKDRKYHVRAVRTAR